MTARQLRTAPSRRRQPWTMRRGVYRLRRTSSRRRSLWPALLLGLALIVGGSLLPWQRFLYPLRFEAELRAQAAAFDLPPSLVAAVVLHESQFSHTAESEAGARGLMQLMPTTASWVAGQRGFRVIGPADLQDPTVNLYLGCAYLDHLRSHFEGNLVATLAAYNAGPSRVDSWAGPSETLEVGRIPFPETRHYVRQVLRSQLRYSALYPELDRPQD